MNTQQVQIFIRFVSLAAIWGASFLFMRILAPEVGGLWTAQARLAIGSLALLIYMRIRQLPLNLTHWQHYTVAGILNCAIPFSLFGIAGTVLPAGYSAVLNAAVPLWATVFATLMLNERITPLRLLALLLGVLGVTLVASPSGNVKMSWLFLGGVGACLLATCCYALSATYVKKYAIGIKPQAMATLSQAIGAILTLPFALASGIPHAISLPAALSAVVLGVVCSGFAFLLFYRLLEEAGAVMTSGVTFLIPLFGIFWGALILHERLGWNVFTGCALIICGAFLLYRSNIVQKVRP